MKQRIKYGIQRQADGSYAILMKYLPTKKLTIHSIHDTYEDAHDELTDIHHKPSQAETMKFMDDLKQSLNKL